VLSVIRIKVREKLHTLTEGSLSENSDLATRGKVVGNFTKGNGVGEPEIYTFLQQGDPSEGKERLPGMTQEAIKEQLRTLKASGDYGRVIRAAGGRREGREVRGLKTEGNPRETTKTKNCRIDSLYNNGQGAP